MDKYKRTPEDESGCSDTFLIDAAKGGNDAAFTQLVVRHKHQVFRLAVHFAHDSYELDDICQEVFIKAYEHLRTFRQEAPFAHWLSRITVNVCHDALKKRKRNKGHLSLEDLPFDIADSSLEAADTARQAYAALMGGLTKLCPDERLVITLLELEEKSVRDVATLTGWSEGNVRVRAHRARQALKKILEGHHES